MTDFTTRIKAGDAWLTNYTGDSEWWKYIDIGGLEMSACQDCVLGQLVVHDEEIEDDNDLYILPVPGIGSGFWGLVTNGSWSTQGKPLTFQESQNLGFAIDDRLVDARSDDDSGERYAALTEQWQTYLHNKTAK